MQQIANQTIGIDFGTTNTSVGYLDHGAMQMVEFPAITAGWSQSSRSLLYFQRKSNVAGKPVSVWTGGEGVQHYLQTDTFDTDVQGRLVQSLKSHLSARNLTGTEIFNRKYRIETLIAKMLGDIRQRASNVLGFDVKRAVAGRPVMFVGADNESDNDFAVARLRSAFHEAGFTDVEFAMEPVAAAYAYGTDNVGGKLVLIGDFGGGTTDFSLVRIPNDVRDRNAWTVLGNTGVGIAGDALDARIVRRLISPALGAESMGRSLGKLLPALPAWVYSNLERWHTLSFLRTHGTMELLRTAQKRALEPEKIAALIAVVQHDLGYRLHQSVQRVKIALSTAEEAEFVLDAEEIHLRAHVNRASFEEWIAPEIALTENSLEKLLSQTGMNPESVDHVFLTGGTSLVPAVRRIFTSRFGEDRVHNGEAFTAVAQGLALLANRS